MSVLQPANQTEQRAAFCDAVVLVTHTFEPALEAALWYRRLISARWQWRRRDRQIIH
jgi:hypothetical protein